MTHGHLGDCYLEIDFFKSFILAAKEKEVVINKCVESRFQKDKPYFSSCNATYPTKAETRLSRTKKKKKRDKKQPLGKFHADNLLEDDKNLRGERERMRKKEEGKKRVKQTYFFFSSYKYNYN